MTGIVDAASSGPVQPRAIASVASLERLRFAVAVIPLIAFGAYAGSDYLYHQLWLQCVHTGLFQWACSPSGWSDRHDTSAWLRTETAAQGKTVAELGMAATASLLTAAIATLRLSRAIRRRVEGPLTSTQEAAGFAASGAYGFDETDPRRTLRRLSFARGALILVLSLLIVICVLDRQLFDDPVGLVFGCCPAQWAQDAYEARQRVLSYEATLMLLGLPGGLIALVVLSRAIRVKSRGD